MKAYTSHKNIQIEPKIGDLLVKDLSHAAMFITAIFTGMRISELKGLVWDAVDFDRQIINVYQRAYEYCVLGLPCSLSRAGAQRKFKRC